VKGSNSLDDKDTMPQEKIHTPRAQVQATAKAKLG
jgi:hypothetical protein